MALINKSFTFVECSECHKVIKVEVGKDIETVRCECSITVAEEEPKPRRRPTQRKAGEDAT